MKNIYLDTAIIRKLTESHYPTDVMVAFQSQSGLNYVISAAHYDDLVGADIKTESNFSNTLNKIRQSKWIAPGNLILLMEIKNFISEEGSSDDHLGRIEFIFNTPEELAYAYPDYIDIVDLHNTRIQYDKIRSKRHEQKKYVTLMEKAEKMKYCSSSHKSKKNPDSYLILTPKALEEHWRILRAEYAKLSDSKSTWRVPNQEKLKQIASMIHNDFPTISYQNLYDLLEADYKTLKAVSNDDFVSFKPAITRKYQLNYINDLMTNPLHLKIGSKQFYMFQKFNEWIEPEARIELYKNTQRLSSVFKAWVKDKKRCQACLIVRETEWNIFRDFQSATVPSTQTDLFHLAVLPYVDILFADKRILEHLLRAKKFIPEYLRLRCKKNGDFCEWVRGLTN